MGAHQGKSQLALLAIGVLAIAGCTSSTPKTTLNTDSAKSSFRLTTLVSEPIEPEWTVALTPVGAEAVRVDDTLLAYAYNGSATYLQAIDAESGDLLWNAPATPGASGNDDDWTPVVTRTSQGTPITLVAPPPLQEPDGDWAHPLEVRDVRTGAVLGTPSPAWVASVDQCELEICMRVNTNESTWYDGTLNPDSLAIELIKQWSNDGVAEGWGIGDNVHLHLDNDTLEWYFDDKMVWETPLSRHLPDGVTPADFGTDVTFQVAVDDPSAPTIVGLSFQVGEEPLRGAFAFSVADGTPLWSKRDFEFCAAASGVQCPLGMQELWWSDAPTPEASYSYAGIDLQTGEPRWEKTFEEVNPQAPNSAPPGFLLVVDGGQPRYVDIATGDEVSVGAPPTMGCASTTTWTGFEGSKPSSPTVTLETGYTYSTCDLAGVATEEPTPRSVVTFGSEFAWRDGTSYAAGWTPGTPVEDPLDDKLAWYYVQTPAGISAYRF